MSRLRTLLQAARDRVSSGFFRVSSGALDGLLLVRRGEIVAGAFREPGGRWVTSGDRLVSHGLIAAEELADIDPAAPPADIVARLAETHGLQVSGLHAEIRSHIEELMGHFVRWEEPKLGFYKAPAPDALDPADPVRRLMLVQLEPGLTFEELEPIFQAATPKPAPEPPAKEVTPSEAIAAPHADPISEALDELDRRVDTDEVEAMSKIDAALSEQPDEPPEPAQDLEDSSLGADLLITLLSVTTSVPETPLAGGEVVVVDDNQKVRETIVASLRAHGLTARCYGGLERVLPLVRRASANGIRPLIVADLFMPRVDGTGVLGGFELLEVAKALDPAPPVILMAHHTTDESRDRAIELGVDQILNRPTTWSDAQKTREFLDTLASQALALIQGPPPGPPVRKSDVATPPLHRLWREAMRELTRPLTRPEILLLLLRFASEVAERAVLLRCQDDRLLGTGQFGVQLANGADPDEAVRALDIKHSEHPLFAAAVTRRQLVRGPSGDGSAARALLEALGGGAPPDAIAGPVFCGQELVAIVYGDNGLTGTPVAETTHLEVFLMTASIALEKQALAAQLGHG